MSVFISWDELSDFTPKEDKSMSVEEDITKSILEELNKSIKAGIGKVPTPEKNKPEEVLPEFTDVPLPKKKGLQYSELFKDLGAKEFLSGEKLEDIVISTVYEVSDWPEEEQHSIPTMESVSGYFPDHSVLYPAMLAREHNLKVLVYGPTGSGKTEMFKFIAAVCKQPYMRINGRADMESDSILGKPWIKEGNMTFQLGELPIGIQNGRLICFDEPFKVPSGIQMALQRYYERGGELFLDDMPGTISERTIKSHERTQLVLCDNVVGTGDNLDQYGATMVQDSSTLNRIDMVLHLDYLDQSKEQEMLTKRYPHLPAHNAKKMVQLANLIRTGYKEGALSVTMSPRNLLTWSELAFTLRDYRKSFEWCMLRRFNRSDSEVQAVKGHYQTVFGD